MNNRLAATLKSKGVSLTTAEFGADGLSLALGTNTGHVLMYDIRSQRPVLTKVCCDFDLDEFMGCAGI